MSFYFYFIKLSLLNQITKQNYQKQIDGTLPERPSENVHPAVWEMVKSKERTEQGNLPTGKFFHKKNWAPSMSQ